MSFLSSTNLAVVPGVGEMADFVLGALVIKKCEQAEYVYIFFADNLSDFRFLHPGFRFHCV